MTGTKEDDNNNDNDTSTSSFYEYRPGDNRIPDHLRATVEHVRIAADVTALADYAFADCACLTHVEFVSPTNLTHIGVSAFGDCIALAQLELPSSVRTLGAEAFSCTALRRLVIPHGVTHLPAGLCADCEDLVSVELPQSLESMGDACFDACTKLVAVHVPPNIRRIPAFAFRDCTHLTAVFVPLELSTIGRNCWKGCTSLTTLALPEDVEFVSMDHSDDHAESMGLHAEYHPLAWCTTLQTLVRKGINDDDDKKNGSHIDGPAVMDYCQHVMEPYPLHQAVAWSQPDAAGLWRAVQGAHRATSGMIEMDATDAAGRNILHLLALHPHGAVAVTKEQQNDDSSSASSALEFVLQTASQVLPEDRFVTMVTSATDHANLTPLAWAAQCDTNRRDVWIRALQPYRESFEGIRQYLDMTKGQ